MLPYIIEGIQISSKKPSSERPSSYPTDDGFDFTGIDSPTPISQIPKFERQNGLAINVFGWDKGVFVHYISKQPEAMDRINLLLIEEKDKAHYTWVKSLSRLLFDQSKHKAQKSTSVIAAYTATPGRIF